jgi:hypothetical protein
LIFDNLISNKASAHDVAAAYCLAMADVRVRLPLGALAIGVWESLAIPPAPEAGDRWFKSNCADFNCGGATAGSCARLLNAYPAGSIPASAAFEMEGQANWRWQLSRKQSSDEP